MKKQVIFATLAAAACAHATVVYNSLPSPQPFNVPSLGYEATATTMFGELIQFAGSSLELTSARVLMSNWALESTYETVGQSAGYTVPLTLNIYNVGPSNAVGSLIGSSTVNAVIPWRPEASGGCGGAWLAGDGQCYNGMATAVMFSFANLPVPAQIIYGLAFNTADYGNPKVGAAGPYNSLNFGLNTGAPSVGSNPLPDTAYWNTSYGGFYNDGGSGGTGTFRQDTNWSPYNAAISFDATSPEPGTLSTMIGGALLCAAACLRKRRPRA